MKGVMVTIFVCLTNLLMPLLIEEEVVQDNIRGLSVKFVDYLNKI